MRSCIKALTESRRLRLGGKWTGLLAILLGLGCTGARAAQIPPDPLGPPAFGKPFAFVGDFSLGVATSRTDYESIDATARRLYIAKMGAGQLLVFDLAANRLIARLDGFPKITGVLAVPQLGELYASIPGAGLIPSLAQALGTIGLSSGRGAVAILDAKTLRQIARVPGGVFPDGIAYDPQDRRIFVSDELGSAITVIDADDNRLVARIRPGGEVGNVQYDVRTRRIYAPLQSRNELAVIDPASARLIARYLLPGAQHPHGLAIAPGGAVGYVTCDHNDRLLAVDLGTGGIIERQPVAHDPDVLTIDRGAHRLYVASESGNLSSFDIGVVNHPVAIGTVFVGKGAHAVAVDPETHRLYFALADVGGRSILRVLAPNF